MDLGMAHRARLIFRCLVMSRPLGPLHREGVTLQAQQVYLADSQVARIIRSVRCVTTRTALGFHRHMLVHEWSLFFGVAFHADCVASRDRSHLTYGGCAVYVVAIAAEQKAFVDAVMVGSGEISFCRHMAAVAKVRLSFCQEVVRFFGIVRRMAVQAAHVVAGMRRRREVPLLNFAPVTTQATRGRLLRRQCRETDDLGDVAAALHMLRPWPVAGLATVSAVERRLEVRGKFEMFFVDLFMAGLTNICADVFGILLRRRAFLLWIPGKSWLDSEQKREQRKNGRCG